MLTDYEYALLNRIYIAQLAATNANLSATRARIARKRREIDRLIALNSRIDKARLALARRAS